MVDFYSLEKGNLYTPTTTKFFIISLSDTLYEPDIYYG